MRRPLVAGNWKMNLNSAQAIELAESLIGAAELSHCDVVVAPPNVYLDKVVRTVSGSKIQVAAQNVHFEKNGAFTGEISVEMLVDLGVTHVILGHSERRQLFGETDQSVNRKLLAVLDAKLTPIICVGETLAEREAGLTHSVVERQFEHAFSGISSELATKVVIAYEPVWAIGTGKTASPAQAQEVHGDLRNLIQNRYNTALSHSIRILYGGSVKADNAAELMSQVDIDGALVGGASLQADAFLKIISAAK